MRPNYFIRNFPTMKMVECILAYLITQNLTDTLRIAESHRNRFSDESIYFRRMLLLLAIMGCIYESVGFVKATGSLAKNYYQLWYLENDKMRRHAKVASLSERFNRLSDEDKQKLVSRGLAQRDDNGLITLKYVCAISYDLMLEPISVRIKRLDGQEDQLVCDLDSLREFMLRHPHASNYFMGTGTLLLQNGQPTTAPYQPNEYKDYVEKLSQRLDSLEAVVRHTAKP